MEVVGEAGDGESVIEMIRHCWSDVVIMDVDMPKMNGVEAARRITSEFPNTMIMALSMHGDHNMRQGMRDAGVMGYLTKGGDSSLLIDEIRLRKANMNDWHSSTAESHRASA